MASIMYYTECPQCLGIAVKDDYYKTDDFYLRCQRCGYIHNKDQCYFDEEANEIYPLDEEHTGYGMFKISDKQGRNQLVPIHEPLTEERAAEYKKEIEREESERDKCYLVSFSDGKLNVLFGEVPDLLYYTYDEYKERYPDFDPYYLQGVTIYI